MYRNASEHQDRTTRRNVRTVCKIWSEEDWNLQDDLTELATKLKDVEGVQDVLVGIPQPWSQATGGQPQADGQPTTATSVNLADIDAAQVHGGPPHIVHGVRHGHLPAAADDNCCCLSHCSVLHTSGTNLRSYQGLNSVHHAPFQLQPEIPRFRQILLKSMEESLDDTKSAVDNLTDFMLNFSNA